MYISDEVRVAVRIAETLQSNNCFLQVLDSNQIGSMGFDLIAKSLESNTTLGKLHLVDNDGKTTMNKKKQLTE